MKHTQEKITCEPEIGEVVLIGDDFKKWLYWPLARVIKKFKGMTGRSKQLNLK